MPAYQLQNLPHRITDNQGTLVAGALLDVYLTGTSTRATLWTSRAMTANLTNPIQADSSGVVPAIFVEAGNRYDLVVKTSGGSVISGLSATSISGIGADQSTDLSSSTDSELGAGMIGFDPVLNYAAGTVGSWNRQDISVFWFIPKAEHASILAGTSTYNAATAIASALTWAIALSPSRLNFPNGRFKCNASLGSFYGSDVTVEFNGARLDFSGVATNTTAIAFDGILGSYTSLSGNATAGDRTVSVASTSGFAVDDYVKIVSEGIWDDSNTDTKLGEINRIQDGYSTVGGDELTSTVIPLVTEVQSTYTTANSAKIAKISPVKNIVLRNGWFIGPAASENVCNGVIVRYGVGVHLEGMRFERFDNAGVFIRNSIQASVRNSRFTKFRPTATGYGVSFGDAASDCSVIGCHFDDVRHAMTTNNTPASDYGITRRISFIGNTVRNSARSASGSGGDAIDTHGGADYITITGNTVIGATASGINVECPNCIVTGNTVKDCGSYGIYVHNEADANGSAVVSNNMVERCAGAGVYVINATRGASSIYRSLSVSGNVVKNVGLTGALAQNAGIVVKTYDETLYNRAVSIMGNTLYTSTENGLYASGVKNGSITGNAVNDFEDYGIVLENCVTVSCTGNSVHARNGTAFPGIYVRKSSGGATPTRNAIVGNTMGLQGGTSAAAGILLSNDVTNSIVKGNVTQGFTGGTNGVTLGSGTGNSTSADNI